LRSDVCSKEAREEGSAQNRRALRLFVCRHACDEPADQVKVVCSFKRDFTKVVNQVARRESCAFRTPNNQITHKVQTVSLARQKKSIRSFLSFAKLTKACLSHHHHHPPSMEMQGYSRPAVLIESPSLRLLHRSR
jgi:hypothetical protein